MKMMTQENSSAYSTKSLETRGIMALIKLHPEIAIITGASSGLGREFARQIDKKYDLDEIWLVARRESRLIDLAESLKTETKIIVGDVTTQEFETKLLEELNYVEANVKILVNSAGLGISEDFLDTSLEDNTQMVDVNMRALTRITYMVLPFVEAGGKILNVASVAAFMPQDKFAVYAASKAYVLNFSRGLNSELKDRDITVTAVCPNPMETEFFKNEITGFKSISIEQVDKVVAKAIRQSERNKDISIQSFLAHVVRFISRVVPHRLVLYLERKFNIVNF